MTILQRYIIRQIIVATAMVFFVILAIGFVIDLLEELRDVGSGDYGFAQALVHVCLELPRTVYQLFPMLMLLGGVIGLGSLAAQHELMVMRSAGFSVSNITFQAIYAALIIITLITIMGEGVVPYAHHAAQVRKQIEQNDGEVVATQSGVWIHQNNDFLHIEKIVGANHLDSVTRYAFDAEHQLVAAYFIKSADLNAKRQWILHDVVMTQFNKDHTTSGFFKKEATWDFALNPKLLNVGVIEPSEMSLSTLHYYYTHLSQNGLQATEFQWEFWKRVLQPLTTLMMMLLAIPFVMQNTRGTSMGRKMLFGVSVGFAFYILNAFLGQFSIVYQFSPLFAAIIPAFLLACYGLLLMLKLRK